MGDASPLACWCGNAGLVPFGPDYAECRECGTLVLRKQLSVSDLAVDDDNTSFYGKQYWLQHQQADLDYPDIYARTRSDLPERNLHWLKALLKYRLPPARVVELGCAHGSFVALMKQAGFSASGVEMSPWVVGFAQRTFGIDVQVGPIEAIDMQPGSLDVIAMMDVLEHLPDPASTMARCLKLLRDNGLLLIQTPEFQEGMDFDRLTSENSPFLSQLKAEEHIYLFSRRSVTEFFHRLGARHVAFEPAIFAHYDMFLAVGKQSLLPNSQQQVEQAMLAIPQARVALALLDMKDRFDAAPVLEAEIQARDQRLEEQYVRADELANARNLAEAQFADLLGKYRELEADRDARGAVIESQGAQVSELLRQLHEEGAAALRLQDNELAQHASALAAERDSLKHRLQAAEEDRAARLEVIEAQGSKLSRLEQAFDERLRELHRAYEEIASAKNSASLLALELESLKQQFAASETDREARLRVIEAQGDKLSRLEGVLHERVRELQQAHEELASARSSTSLLALELESVKSQFAASEADREARLEVIESQGNTISGLQAQVHAQLQRLQQLQVELADSREAVQELSLELSTLHGRHEACLAELTLSEERNRELRTVTDEKIAGLESAGASLRDEIRLRDEAMGVLSSRLWWKLGKLIRAL